MALEMQDVSAGICDAIRKAIEEKIAGALVEASGSGGHYEIRVVSTAFADKSTLEKQRMVYGAITPLMSGDNAPVHAVDRLKTLTE